jgi:hypothetical protein
MVNRRDRIMIDHVDSHQDEVGGAVPAGGAGEGLPPPVIGPLLALLRSRKAMVALAFLLAYVLTLAIPALEPHREGLQTAILVFGSALIAGIAWEDGAEKGTPVSVGEAVELVEAGPRTPAGAGKVIAFEAAEAIFGEE